MRWIVTGGAGFIGSNATRALVDRGHDVVVLDNLSRPTSRLNLEWLGGGFEFVEGDVRDSHTVERVVEGADVVLHLAGQVAVTTSVANPREDFDLNALGTFVVLDAVRRRSPEAVFVNASTNKVYGALEGHRVAERATRYVDADFPAGVPETHPVDPVSPYGCSKAAADLYTLDYARIYGVRAVTLRQSCIYGPRQFGIEDQGWVAWFAIASRLGLPLTLYGNGKQVRDLLHVDDLVELYLAVATWPDAAAGRAYNVGGGPANAVSLLELLDRLGADTPTHAPARPGDQLVFVADTTRAREELGWSPTTSLDDGLDDLLRFVAENAASALAVRPG